jgi:urease accessory protein
MDAEARHLRRKLITLQGGDEVMVDLEKTMKFDDRDCLILDDGRLVQIIASDEELLEVTARDPSHLTQLAWHIGNRHLEAQIEATRILIRRDHVIAKMLEQLGATVTEVRETFTPEHGAYAHGH